MYTYDYSTTKMFYLQEEEEWWVCWALVLPASLHPKHWRREGTDHLRSPREERVRLCHTVAQHQSEREESSNCCKISLVILLYSRNLHVVTKFRPLEIFLP